MVFILCFEIEKVDDPVQSRLNINSSLTAFTSQRCMSGTEACLVAALMRFNLNHVACYCNYSPSSHYEPHISLGSNPSALLFSLSLVFACVHKCRTCKQTVRLTF